MLRSGRICKPLIHKKYPSNFDVTEYSKDTLNWFRSFKWSARGSWKWSVKFKDVIRTLWDMYDRTFLRKDRSSYLRCSIKNVVLRNWTKFTAKHLCQSHFFKVAGIRPATLLKKRPAHMFSCEFCEISKNTFVTEHLWTAAS